MIIYEIYAWTGDNRRNIRDNTFKNHNRITFCITFLHWLIEYMPGQKDRAYKELSILQINIHWTEYSILQTNIH